MARCGRCGLWAMYPEDHPEKKWAGICPYYQLRLTEGDVYEKRECDDFIERIPGATPLQHFDLKIKRDNLGTAYEAARRAKILAYVGIGISITGLLWNILLSLIRDS